MNHDHFCDVNYQPLSFWFLFELKTGQKGPKRQFCPLLDTFLCSIIYCPISKSTLKCIFFVLIDGFHYYSGSQRSLCQAVAKEKLDPIRVQFFALLGRLLLKVGWVGNFCFIHHKAKMYRQKKTPSWLFFSLQGSFCVTRAIIFSRLIGIKKLFSSCLPIFNALLTNRDNLGHISWFFFHSKKCFWNKIFSI